MPLQATSGAASYDAFGGGAAAVPQYIEDVFSTYLYTGNGASGQSIVNGIDLSTKGGLVWLKSRTTPSGSSDNNLYDTARGASQLLISNTTAGNTTATRLSFQTTGFNLTNEASSTNESGVSYVSWTFREQPKFFDIVTYTGNGSTQNIAHNLGSVPGCIIVKRLNNASNTGWPVYHRYDYTRHGFLNTSDTFTTAQEETWFGNNVISVAPTSTVFTVGSNQDINANTNTYVAYIFAHNAGGFGLTGTDNVISCGSFTTDGSGVASVNLGFEPQWLLLKNSTISEDWWLFDTMRRLTASNTERYLIPSSSIAEGNATGVSINSTGFTTVNGTISNSSTYIYVAIRRGPMKVPTSGTSVFGLNARTGTGANATVTGNAGVTDLAIVKNKESTPVWLWSSRLTNTGYLSSNAATSETAAGTTILQAIPWDVMDGVKVGTTSTITNASSNTFINYLFKRAPSFFDVVCYTGTGVARTINHNLGVAPELMIVRSRSAAANWEVYAAPLGATKYLRLDLTSAAGTYSDFWNDTAPTASVFTVATDADVNGSGRTQVAYLFATCAGVSKVGSYTGTATTLQIDCGFTAGARFVLIKRTNSTGDWYVWDTARGIVSGNDSYLLLNSTAAEVTSTDYIDTYSAGFEISSTAPAAINASGGAFIFLAIA